MSEYTVTIFVVILAVVGMTVYFKRAIQGKIFDAQIYMVNEVRDRTAGQYTGNLYYAYEPYYVQTNSIVDRNASDTVLLSGGPTEKYQKIFDQTTIIQTNSETLPPREFDATTPR